MFTVNDKFSDYKPQPVLITLASVPTGHVVQDIIVQFLYWPAWHSTEGGVCQRRILFSDLFTILWSSRTIIINIMLKLSVFLSTAVWRFFLWVFVHNFHIKYTLGWVVLTIYLLVILLDYSICSQYRSNLETTNHSQS